MKINHFICPNCGHDFYATGAYASCDACYCTFYAGQSRTSNLTFPKLYLNERLDYLEVNNLYTKIR